MSYLACSLQVCALTAVLLDQGELQVGDIHAGAQ